MNHNADFSNLRFVLNHADSNIERLNKLQFFCGYQAQITDVTKRVRKMLCDKGYFAGENYNVHTDAAHNHALRRIVLFLMLNTSIPLAERYDLLNDNAVVHLLHKFPAIPPFLLLHMMWSLNLHPFVCEALAVTPAWFAVEFLDQAVVSLKSSTVPELNRAMRAGRFVVAAFRSVARTAAAATTTTTPPVDPRWVNVGLEMVREFLTANENSMSGMRNSWRSKHLGYVMKHSLETAQACIRVYRNVDDVPADADVEQVFGILDPRTEAASSGDAQPVQQATANDQMLRQLIMGQLTAIQTSAMMISLEVYLEWAEWDVDDELTMQRHIGESAHRLLQLLNGDASLQHDVTAQLVSIAIQPKTLATVISESNLGEIMTKLDSVAFIELDVRCMWLTEFLLRGILVFGNDECMDTLEANVAAINTEHLALLINAVHGLHGILDDAGDRLRRLVISASARLQCAEVVTLIGQSLELNRPNGVDLELYTFGGQVTRLINNCSAAVLRTAHTLTVMMQNVTRFVDTTLEAALKTAKHQTEMCDFYDTLPPALIRPFVQRTLTAMVSQCEQMPDDERGRLVKLLVRLHASQFESRHVFLQFFYRLICDASEAKQMQTVLCLLNVLSGVLRPTVTSEGDGDDATRSNDTLDRNSTSLSGMAGPLLVVCAALIEKYRWDLLTYTETHCKIVELTIEIMHDIRRRYLPVASAEDREFIVAKVAGYKPLTRFYFQRFGLERHQQPVEFAAFVSPVVTGADVRPETMLEALLSAMVRCTRKECAMLAQNATLRPFWFLAIALMGRVVSARPTISENNYGCMRHAAQSLAHVVRVNFVEGSAAAQEKWMLLHNYIRLFRKLENLAIYDDLCMDAHYVILELLKGVERQGAGLDGEDEIKNFQKQRNVMRAGVFSLRDCPAKMLLVVALA